MYDPIVKNYRIIFYRSKYNKVEYKIKEEINMRAFIWDKISSIGGVDSDYLFSIKHEFFYDDVIAIVDEYGFILHFETRYSLMEKYDIHDVNEPMQVALEVIRKLDEGYPLKPNGLVENISDSELFFLQSVMYDMRLDNDDEFVEEIYSLQEDDFYIIKVPECKFTSTEIEDDEPWKDKSITVVLENVVFPQYTTLESMLESKVLQGYKSRIDRINNEIKNATRQEDMELVTRLTDSLTETMEELMNTDGFVLNLSATKVYEYDNLIIVKTKDEQTVIINRDIVKSCRHSVLEYEKRRGTNDTFPVHYETIYVKLEKDTDPELREFGDSVYVTY